MGITMEKQRAILESVIKEEIDFITLSKIARCFSIVIPILCYSDFMKPVFYYNSFISCFK